MPFESGDAFYIPQRSTLSPTPFYPLALLSRNGLYSLQPVRADTADQPYFPATGRSSSAAVSQNSAQKKAASKQKSADWTKEETEVRLQAWGPNYDRLKRASSQDRARIWSDIYANYKDNYFDNNRNAHSFGFPRNLIDRISFSRSRNEVYFKCT